MRSLAVTLFAALGCYAPAPQAGAPCSSTGSCPDGHVCSPATVTCELRAADGGSPDVARLDGASDALIDAPIDAQPDAPPSLPELVQQASGFTTVGSSLSVTLPVAPVAGHVLVMMGGDRQAGLDAVSGGGATWTRAAASTVEANIEVWTGVTNGSSATVTISLSGNLSQFSMSVSEWAKLEPLGLVDGMKVGNGTTGPASAGAVTTVAAPRLLLFAFGAFGPSAIGTPSDGPWTPMLGVSAGVAQSEWYRVVTAPGTFAPSVTQDGGGWDASLVVLRGVP